MRQVEELNGRMQVLEATERIVNAEEIKARMLSPNRG
jgi:hypothetical protein